MSRATFEARASSMLAARKMFVDGVVKVSCTQRPSRPRLRMSVVIAPDDTVAGVPTDAASR